MENSSFDPFVLGQSSREPEFSQSTSEAEGVDGDARKDDEDMEPIFKDREFTRNYEIYMNYNDDEYSSDESFGEFVAGESESTAIPEYESMIENPSSEMDSLDPFYSNDDNTYHLTHGLLKVELGSGEFDGYEEMKAESSYGENINSSKPENLTPNITPLSAEKINKIKEAMNAIKIKNYSPSAEMFVKSLLSAKVRIGDEV